MPETVPPRESGGFLGVLRRLNHKHNLRTPPVPDPLVVPPVSVPAPMPARPAAPSARPALAGPLPPNATANATASAPGNCPVCKVPFLASGPGGRLACPLCGRHAAPPAPRAATVALATAARPTVRPVDRREEELIAAWMIGAPIPCSKCRTTLKRVAVGEYSCPSCGARSRVPNELLSATSRRAAAAAAAERAGVDRRGDALDVGREGPVPR